MHGCASTARALFSREMGKRAHRWSLSIVVPHRDLIPSPHSAAPVISTASAEEMRPLASRRRWRMRHGTIARQVGRYDGARSMCRGYCGTGGGIRMIVGGGCAAMAKSGYGCGVKWQVSRPPAQHGRLQRQYGHECCAPLPWHNVPHSRRRHRPCHRRLIAHTPHEAPPAADPLVF